MLKKPSLLFLICFCLAFLARSQTYRAVLNPSAGIQSAEKLRQDSGMAPAGLLTSEAYDKNFEIIPLVSSIFGSELSEIPVYESSFGLQLRAEKGKFSVWSRYAFLKQQLPSTQRAYLQGKRFLPFAGGAQVVNHSVESHWAEFWVNFDASKHFDLSFGRKTQFYGDGIRSFMLSNYGGPFWQGNLEISFGKVKYTTIYARFNQPEFELTTFQTPDERLLINQNSQHWNDYSGLATKYATMHFLEFRPWDFLTIGLFETVVWKPRDTLIDRGFDVNYLNPVIFFRPVEFAIGSSDNSIMGTNFKWRLANNLHFYGQWVIDEFLLSAMRADAEEFFNRNADNPQSGWWANKHAGQLGIQFKQLKSEENYWVVKAEANYSRPFSFTHASPLQSFSHQGFAVGHPYGANFRELAVSADAVQKRFKISALISATEIGLDYGAGIFGSEVLLPYNARSKDYGNVTTQGVQTKVLSATASFAYLLHEKTNLHVSADMGYQSFSNRLETHNALWFQLGVRTYFLPQSGVFLVNR